MKNCVFLTFLLATCTVEKTGEESEEREEGEKIFLAIINRIDRLSPDQFHGVFVKHIPVIEDVLAFKILLLHNLWDGNKQTLPENLLE